MDCWQGIDLLELRILWKCADKEKWLFEWIMRWIWLNTLYSLRNQALNPPTMKSSTSVPSIITLSSSIIQSSHPLIKIDITKISLSTLLINFSNERLIKKSAKAMWEVWRENHLLIVLIRSDVKRDLLIWIYGVDERKERSDKISHNNFLLSQIKFSPSNAFSRREAISLCIVSAAKKGKMWKINEIKIHL